MTIHDYIGLCMSIQDIKGLYRTISDSKGLYDTIQDYTWLYTGCIKKLFPLRFLSISQLLLGLGIISFSFLKSPFNGLIKNVKKFDSRCKICQEIQHFVQANTNLFNTNVHIRNLSNTEISELQKTDYISLWNYMFVYSWKNCNPNHPIWPRSPHWNYWNYFRNKWLTRRTQC